MQPPNLEKTPLYDILDGKVLKEACPSTDGYVQLIDCSPRLVREGLTLDDTVAETARFTKGTYWSREEEHEKNIRLVRRLLKDQHTSPFEFVEFVWEMELPIFVARQLVRHRTASISERSLRASEGAGVFIPCRLDFRKQDPQDRQATFDPVVDHVQKLATDIVDKTWRTAYDSYRELLRLGVCREQARVVLPVSTHTTWRFKLDLHNTRNFLKLRIAKGAQKETREYAEAMLKIATQLAPESLLYD